jgi:hypothetical protein
MGAVSRYKKKPVEVDAVKFLDTPKRIHAISEWIGEDITVNYADPKNPTITIHTLEGDVKASHGDYIIKGIKGEFYPCKPDIFHETYSIVKVNV